MAWLMKKEGKERRWIFPGTLVLWWLITVAVLFGCATNGQSGEGGEPQTPEQPTKTLEQSIETLGQDLTSVLQKKPNILVAVLDFHDLAGNVSAFGRLVAEELTTKLFQLQRVQVVERGLLNKALEELKFNLTGMVDPTQAKHLGRQVGADGIVTGTVTDLGHTVKINARLIEVETGDVLAAAGVQTVKTKVIAQLLRHRLRGSGMMSAVPSVFQEGQPVPDSGSASAYVWESPKFRIEVEDLRIGPDEITMFLSYVNTTGEALTLAFQTDLQRRPKNTYLLDDKGNRYGSQRSTGFSGGWLVNHFSGEAPFLSLPSQVRVPVTLSFTPPEGVKPSQATFFDLISEQLFVGKNRHGRHVPAGGISVSVRHIQPRS